MNNPLRLSLESSPESGDRGASKSGTNAIAAQLAAPADRSSTLQNPLAAAGLSVKVRSENGGHGCRRLTGWDGKGRSARCLAPVVRGGASW